MASDSCTRTPNRMHARPDVHKHFTAHCLNSPTIGNTNTHTDTHFRTLLLLIMCNSVLVMMSALVFPIITHTQACEGVCNGFGCGSTIFFWLGFGACGLHVFIVNIRVRLPDNRCSILLSICTISLFTLVISLSAITIVVRIYTGETLCAMLSRDKWLCADISFRNNVSE